MTVRVLSIDGGGIRGLIAAHIIAALEEAAGRPCAGMFDLVCGTSSGGILATALVHPTMRATGRDLVAFYEQDGPRIFNRTILRRLSSLFSLADEKYSDSHFNAVLKRQFSAQTLLSALPGNVKDQPELLITTYDIERRAPFLFKSWRARGDRWDCDDENERSQDRDAKLWEIARATAAAPTFFEPFPVTLASGKRAPLIDGGVYANNPAMIGYVAARRIFHCGQDVLIISLGTGEDRAAIPFAAARNWGLIEWSRSIFRVLLGGSSDVVDYQLKELLPGAYWRLTRMFDGEQARRLGSIDDTSKRNLAALGTFSRLLVEEQADSISALAKRLISLPRPRAG